ncbi:MAG: hypothetical protein FJ368_01235 [Pelagibacterales bacterium]|nr:hypothetical protein [Pelagibacterales bacterium]
MKNFTKVDKRKYSNPPNPSEANFIVFSMIVRFEELEAIINSFPQHGTKRNLNSRDTDYQNARACTVAWSGSKGNNVPILPWNLFSIGVVIDPEKIDAPYGDIIACNSNDLVPKIASEAPKAKYASLTKTDSKYTGKTIVRRLNDQLSPITNQATILKKEDGSHEIFPEGKIDVFAANIWRKYFKENRRKTNEVLCIQKSDCTNPIDGIFLDVTSNPYATIPSFARFFHLSREENRQSLKKLFESNQNLKLYIYDRNLEDHIVRVVDNITAIALIDQRTAFTKDFTSTLPVYQGVISATKEISETSQKSTSIPNKPKLETTNVSDSASSELAWRRKYYEKLGLQIQSYKQPAEEITTKEEKPDLDHKVEESNISKYQGQRKELRKKYYEKLGIHSQDREDIFDKFYEQKAHKTQEYKEDSSQNENPATSFEVIKALHSNSSNKNQENSK